MNEPAGLEVLRLLRLWLTECSTYQRHTLTRQQVEALVTLPAVLIVPSRERVVRHCWLRLRRHQFKFYKMGSMHVFNRCEVCGWIVGELLRHRWR